MESSLEKLSISNADLDITQRYFKACSDGLKMGELLRHEEFSLRDSVAALEIMDPKMDSGMLNLTESPEMTYDCSQLLAPAQILAIMDRLFASEMAWHSGSSLLQTLYTCVYFVHVLSQCHAGHEPRLSQAQEQDEPARRLLDDVLWPYVAVTIKSTITSREEYQRAHLYEEEDIVTNDFGLVLAMSIADDVLFLRLQRGQEYLTARRKDMPKQASVLDQLHLRLSLRISFQRLLGHIQDPWPWPDLVNVIQRSRGNIKPTTVALENAPSIFNTKIQQVLISTSPPRPMVSMTPFEAYIKFDSLCADLARFSTNLQEAAGSPSNLIGLMRHFCRSRSLPLPLVRASIKNLCLDIAAPTNYNDKFSFLFHAMRDSDISTDTLLKTHQMLSEAHPSANDHVNLRQLIEWTLEQMSNSYNMYLEALCDNPSRQRRNLCKLMRNLDHIQTCCRECDESLHRFLQLRSKVTIPRLHDLEHWACNFKCEISTAILLIGIEIDLYRPHEWRLIYWLLRRVMKLTIDDHGKNVSRKRNTVYLRAISLLCDAYMAFLAALELLQILEVPNLSFTNDELLFRHRIQPFVTLEKDGDISFEAYKLQSMFDLDSSKGLLDRASSDFKDARDKLVELSKLGSPSTDSSVPALAEQSRVDMKALVRCCVHHIIVISSIKGQSLAGKKICWNKEGHCHFPTISIV